MAKVYTWHGDEELDGVPVSVERELRLRHVAVRHEALRPHALTRRQGMVHLANLAAEGVGESDLAGKLKVQYNQF